MLGANLGFLYVALTWGSIIPVLNILLRTWDPLFLSAARYLLAVPVLFLCLWLFESRTRDRRAAPAWRVWLLGAIGIGLFAPLYTLGIANSHPITAAIVGAAGPPIAAVVARVAFRVPFDSGMWPAIALAFAGSLLATYDPSRATGRFDIRGGEILILLAAACWSWFSMACQRWLDSWSQLRITTYTTATGASCASLVYVAAGTLGLATLPPPPPSSPWDVVLLAWIVLALVVLGLFLWNYGVRRLGIVVGSLYLNLMPIAAIGITAALGTLPTAMQLLGAALAIAGVLQSQLRHLPARWRVPTSGGADPPT